MQISHWLQRSTKTYTQITVLSIKGLIKKKKKKKKTLGTYSTHWFLVLGLSSHLPAAAGHTSTQSHGGGPYGVLNGVLRNSVVLNPKVFIPKILDYCDP